MSNKFNKANQLQVRPKVCKSPPCGVDDEPNQNSCRFDVNTTIIRCQQKVNIEVQPINPDLPGNDPLDSWHFHLSHGEIELDNEPTNDRNTDGTLTNVCFDGTWVGTFHAVFSDLSECEVTVEKPALAPP